MELTPRQRQHLKRLAHHLKPVVQVGKDGISPSVASQLDRALTDHELVKVKLTESAPLDRDEAGRALPGAAAAFLVQNLGKVFVLYRPHPTRPRIELPWDEPAADDEEEPYDLETARAPRARAPGLLGGSVRERGPRPAPPPARTAIRRPDRPATAPERPRATGRPARRRSTGRRPGGRRGGRRPR